MIRLRPKIRSPAARAAINFSEEIVNSLGKPKIDDKLTLLSDFGEMEAICVQVRDDPATSGGTLLKVMARGPFTQGEQVWIVDRDGSKIGATVEYVFKQTVDSEVAFSTVLPA